MIIRPYKPKDFNDILAMIHKKFMKAKEHNPNLPVPLFLDSITKDKLPKDLVVATKNDKVVGYIGGYFLDDINSHPNGFLTTLSLYGVCDNENKRYVLFKLIQMISDVALKKASHNLAMIVHAYDKETLDILVDLGYGKLTLDLIREVETIALKPLEGLEIETVTKDDLALLMPLFIGIQDHLMASPIYLHDSDLYDSIIPYYKAQLEEGTNGLFMAKVKGQIVGYIKYTTSQVNRQELDAKSTLGINGAYILPDFRNQSIMDYLLNQVILKAKEIGYTHIMTDCETANFEAVNYWKKHFEPYSYGLLRHINSLKK